MARTIFRGETDLKVHLCNVTYNNKKCRDRLSPEPQEDVVQLPLQFWSRKYCVVQGRTLMSGRRVEDDPDFRGTVILEILVSNIFSKLTILAFHKLLICVTWSVS